ncbi:hypothetical protein CL628_03835 [bacterium]|nr:hypothetical protein [bacterium]
MLHISLQVWAGVFYLLNKIFLSRKERTEGVVKRRWHIAAWIAYPIGLPAWVIIFISERNWIAAAVESGGAPAMLMGLIIAIRGKGKEPRWLDFVALVAIVGGFGFSLWDFGGLTVLNQWLETGIVVGFLVGTYLLAKEIPSGYLWFMFMNVLTATLMFREQYYWLAGQQIVSLGFVIDAYRIQRSRNQSS